MCTCDSCSYTPQTEELVGPSRRRQDPAIWRHAPVAVTESGERHPRTDAVTPPPRHGRASLRASRRLTDGARRPRQPVAVLSASQWQYCRRPSRSLIAPNPRLRSLRPRRLRRRRRRRRRHDGVTLPEWGGVQERGNSSVTDLQCRDVCVGTSR